MEGHLLASMLEENPPPFPFVALLVSGGLTMLVEVKTLVNTAFSVSLSMMRLAKPLIKQLN